MQVSSEIPLTQMSVVIRKIYFCSLIFPSLITSYNSFLLAAFYLFRKKMKLIYDEMSKTCVKQTAFYICITSWFATQILF